MFGQFGLPVPFGLLEAGFFGQVAFPKPVGADNVQGGITALGREMNLAVGNGEKVIGLHVGDELGCVVLADTERSGDTFQGGAAAFHLEFVDMFEGVFAANAFVELVGFLPAGQPAPLRPEEEGGEG